MPLSLKGKCSPDIKTYIYGMIETLLPDCTEEFLDKGKFKMLELWADAEEEPRVGWIRVI